MHMKHLHVKVKLSQSNFYLIKTCADNYGDIFKTKIKVRV
jgi:hypothetical protein